MVKVFVISPSMSSSSGLSVIFWVVLSISGLIPQIPPVNYNKYYLCIDRQMCVEWTALEHTQVMNLSVEAIYLNYKVFFTLLSSINIYGTFWIEDSIIPKITFD